MAGSGRRVFAPGEVLTASNVMNYLQDQAVMNFADDGARGSAIGTAVSEGMVSYLADTNDVQVYDGSAWLGLGPSGRIIQSLQYSTTTTVFQTSATYATTGLTGTITPTSASSKILVLVSQNGLSKEQADTYGRLRLVRTLSGVTTTLSEFEKSFSRLAGSPAIMGVGGASLSYIDTPNTTSSITYRTEVQNANAAGFVSVQQQGSESTLILIEVSA
jgi:hypothetical protein